MRENEITLAVLPNVREHAEGWPVELVYSFKANRLVLRAWNEGQNAIVDLDLFDIAEWLSPNGTERLLGDE
jgi:hypothetical protein